MELQLENRDYVPDGHGGVTGLRGMEALLARTLFRLTARRGALPFLPELGSRLYQLRRAKPVQWDSMARQYVAEALAGERELAVTEVAGTAGGRTSVGAGKTENRGRTGMDGCGGCIEEGET